MLILVTVSFSQSDQGGRIRSTAGSSRRAREWADRGRTEFVIRLLVMIYCSLVRTALPCCMLRASGEEEGMRKVNRRLEC